MEKGKSSQQRLLNQVRYWRQKYEKLQEKFLDSEKKCKKRGFSIQKVEGDKKKTTTEKTIKTELQDIHHRVKNHLNLIYNILYFQKQYIEDDRLIAILENTQKRIKSIALVHEHLCRSNNSNQVQFSRYMKTLLKEIMLSENAVKKKVTLKTDIDAVFVDLTTAIHCGLIVNEWVDDLLTQEFSDNRKAEILVVFKDQKDGTYALTASEKGIAPPSNVQWKTSNTMGTFLVDALAESLKGKWAVDVNPGISFRLCFQLFPK